MSPTAEPVLAHVLFMDIVGCSKLPSDEQKRIVGRLQELVRESAEFRHSREHDQLISLPTGDGMALAFFNKLDAAVLCAIEVTKSIQAESLCKIRMGVHTGPVFVMDDINHKRNISGAGINRAERVMSCGGDGHILLSSNAAESLRHLSAWRDKIHEIGECQIKDGWIHVWNLVDGPIGNPAMPAKSKRYVRRRKAVIGAGLAALAAALVAVVAGAFLIGRSGKGSQFAKDQASIAVLPFLDFSPEKNQEYFSDGLAEELMNALAKIPGLRVIGRTSSFQYKGKSEDSRVIGDRLNVTTLLEGSVRKQARRTRIRVQLIKAADGINLWSDTYEREVDDIFAVQEEIARAVTGALKVRLLGENTSPPSATTKSPEAYNAYLMGRFFFERPRKETLEQAVGYFEQATKLDSGYAAAWTGLARSRITQAGSAWVPEEDGYRQARAAVERALALNPDLGEAQVVIGWIKMFHDWDWAGADAAYRRALALAPGNPLAIRGAGTLAFNLGRLDDAITDFRRAIEIDPLDVKAHRSLGNAYYYAARPEEAKAALTKALELARDGATTHKLLALVNLAQSRPQQALLEAEKEKHPAYRPYTLALAYHALGRNKESDASLTELIATFAQDAPYQIAQVYAYRGEADRAFGWLDRAYTEHDPGLAEIKGDPLLTKLRRDPRLTALLKKLRLPA